MLLRRTGRADLTAHGFRAIFMTWASERRSFQNEIVEADGRLGRLLHISAEDWQGRRVQEVAGTAQPCEFPLCFENDRLP
jgi:hypothetical protein